MTGVALDDGQEFVLQSVSPQVSLLAAEQSTPRTRTGRAAPVSPFSGGGYGLNRRQAIAALGEVLYAAELPDGVIKIGWTKQLDRRLYHLGAGTTLLAVKAGAYADEQAVHRTLVAHRARGHEHYHRCSAVLDVVNDWRRSLGLPVLPLG